MKFIKDKLIQFVRNNWQLKLLSLFLALIIWFVICEYVDPDTDKMVNDIAISVNYEGSTPQKEGLSLMTAVDETVSVRVSGSRDTIALMNYTKITAYLDISNVTRSGEYDLPVKIDLGGQNLQLVSQTVETVKMKFDVEAVTPIKVNPKVSGSVPEGYIREEPTMLNNFVTVTGPKSVVDTIVSADVEIKQDIFKETSSFDCSYTLVDKDGNAVSTTFLKTDIDKVNVTISVVKEKTVPFAVNVVNSSGGMDSSFCTVKIQPENIVVAGNAEVLDTQNSIPLGEIDVAEKTENFETSIAVVLPNGLKNVNNVETVKVSVAFNDVQTKTINLKKISLDNVPDGTNAKISEKTVSVKVRGLAEDLKKLNSDNVSLIADVGNKVLSDGKTRLNAVVDFPDELKVGAVGKYQITVVVS